MSAVARSDRDAVILAGARTPIGRYGGALAERRPDDLAAAVVAAAAEQAGFAADEVDEVALGCANGAGEDNRDVARMAALLAGLDVATPGVTVNRLCGSGLEAVVQASRAIRVGDAQRALAGGVESMSRAPLVLMKSARGFARGDQQLVDSALGWRLVNPRMPSRHTVSLGVTAENVARAYGVSREDQDAFALSSHERALAARAAGVFADEILPLPEDGRTRPAVAEDEGPRADSSLAALAALRPAFAQGGTVTAGNSSPLSDGAACVALASAGEARRRGLAPLARVVASAACGVEPDMMGIGPVPASRLALRRAGIEVADLDLVELNEAFAAQALAAQRELGIDPEIVNVNGGAIALGHPLGCSGARLVLTLARELARRGGRYGLATMCVGVGQGVAIVIERDES